MKNMDIIETMEKYGLTLRKLPNKATHLWAYASGKSGEIEERVVSEMTEEAFEKMQKNGNMLDCRWCNGFVVRKFRREIELKGGGWLVKIDNGSGCLQVWNRKFGDFFGKTPEEAITKAVKYIEDKRKEVEDKNRLAGI